jgi:hypothetical protein
MKTLQEYGNRLFWDGVIASKLDRYLARNMEPDEAFLQLRVDEGKETIFSLEKPTRFNYKNSFAIKALPPGAPPSDIQLRVWAPKTIDHPESILSLLVFDKRWRGKVSRRGNLFMDREILWTEKPYFGTSYSKMALCFKMRAEKSSPFRGLSGSLR